MFTFRDKSSLHKTLCVCVCVCVVVVVVVVVVVFFIECTGIRAFSRNFEQINVD